MEKCEDRKKLERLLKQRKDVEAQIRALTFNDAGKSYRRLLQLAIEKALASKHGSARSYKFYNEYNQIKVELYKKLGVSSKMLTKAEYLASIGLLDEMGYNVSEELEGCKEEPSGPDKPLSKGAFDIPNRIYNLLVRHVGHEGLTPRYILSITEDNKSDIPGMGAQTWVDILHIQANLKLYFEEV